MLVFSIETTLGSSLSFQASWLVPTSIAYTFVAPFWSIQSVKPPVDEPMSIHTLPSRTGLYTSIAFSSLRPPLLTYFKVLPFTSISTSLSNLLPALSSLWPFTKTSPAIMTAFAFSLDSKNPLSVRSTSSLSFIINYLLKSSSSSLVRASSFIFSAIASALNPYLSHSSSTLPCSI